MEVSNPNARRQASAAFNGALGSTVMILFPAPAKIIITNHHAGIGPVVGIHDYGAWLADISGRTLIPNEPERKSAQRRKRIAHMM